MRGNLSSVGTTANASLAAAAPSVRPNGAHYVQPITALVGLGPALWHLRYVVRTQLCELRPLPGCGGLCVLHAASLLFSPHRPSGLESHGMAIFRCRHRGSHSRWPRARGRHDLLPRPLPTTSLTEPPTLAPPSSSGERLLATAFLAAAEPALATHVASPSPIPPVGAGAIAAPSSYAP